MSDPEFGELTEAERALIRMIRNNGIISGSGNTFDEALVAFRDRVDKIYAEGRRAKARH